LKSLLNQFTLLITVYVLLIFIQCEEDYDLFLKKKKIPIKLAVSITDGNKIFSLTFFIDSSSCK